MAIYSAPVMAVLDRCPASASCHNRHRLVVPGGTSRDGEVLTSPVQVKLFLIFFLFRYQNRHIRYQLTEKTF
jgi:hypothetical protein